MIKFLLKERLDNKKLLHLHLQKIERSVFKQRGVFFETYLKQPSAGN